MNNECPCMSGLAYSACCEPLHSFKEVADTPEKLMRSRYSAYALGLIDYIQNTMSGPALSTFNPVEAEKWARNATWLGLRVLKAPKPGETSGTVEYTAFYAENNIPHTLHEISEFRKENGEWKYFTGKIL